MANRSRRPPLEAEPGTRLAAILQAIARNEVARDDQNGARRGMWALYRHGDAEVGMAVRQLSRYELIDIPLLGPPVINANGRAVLGRRGLT